MVLNTQSLSSLLNHLPLSSLSPPSPQAQRQQRLCSGLGQDGGAVAERERGGGAEESTEDDATTVSQPDDREHPHVDRRRRHAPAGRNGPIGHAGGRRHTPPTQLHPLYCFSIWITLHLLSPPTHPSVLSCSRAVVGAFSIFTSWYCSCSLSVCYHGSPPLLPVSPSRPQCFTASPAANSSGCIVFCIVRITLYMSCRNTEQWQKKMKNLNCPTAVTYRTWTYTDKLSYYLYYFALGFEFDPWMVSTEGHSYSATTRLSSFYGWWIVCKQLPKERFAKPIRKFNFCMEMHQNE